MWREWKTEWIKVRYRRIGLIIAAFLGLIFMWISWALQDLPQDQIDDGFRLMFLQLPMLDTILMPTMIAMLASRLCDAEVKGDTLKLLCTLEKKGRLFDMKILTGVCYVTVFVAVETAMIFLENKVHGFVRPLNPVQLLYFILQIYVVSLAVLLLQICLSFFFENQIFPLAAGLFGSFAGLFAWFFRNGFLKRCLLWGYYSQLCFIINDWNPETRIVTYHDAPFDYLSLCILLLILAAEYTVGKRLFLRKEI